MVDIVKAGNGWGNSSGFYPFQEISLHGDSVSGDDAHHVAESIFKSFARALARATSLGPRPGGAVPSSKGLL